MLSICLGKIGTWFFEVFFRILLINQFYYWAGFLIRENLIFLGEGLLDYRHMNSVCGSMKKPYLNDLFGFNKSLRIGRLGSLFKFFYGFREKFEFTKQIQSKILKDMIHSNGSLQVFPKKFVKFSITFEWFSDPLNLSFHFLIRKRISYSIKILLKRQPTHPVYLHPIF